MDIECFESLDKEFGKRGVGGGYIICCLIFFKCEISV